jgi:DNA-binding response OmpR family regulator
MLTKETGDGAARLGGARADFVASLGKKVADARAVLGALDLDRGSEELRRDLIRRLHALGLSARMLRFEAMAQTIETAEELLADAAQANEVTPLDLEVIAQALDDLPALAWSAAAPQLRRAHEAAGDTLTPPPPSLSALVIGAAALAEALTDTAGTMPFSVERTDDVTAALGIARAVAPDILVVDGDVEGAVDLVESLLDDPLTEPTPIVVVGSFAPPAVAARFIALGVQKTLAKPISYESLRGACEDAIAQKMGKTERVALGEPTLEQLGDRLAEEIRAALVGSVDAASREHRIPLGDGTEVLGAVWGAIARVREVVMARTDGFVRFPARGPEGAIHMAYTPDVARADRSSRMRGAAADVALVGRKIVVADDDPGVTWFIADLLRTAGCEVFEALDGATALDLAHRHMPDLVISDIVMPGLDGFALCRALRRDAALRDVPVVLLSWKEDLLQRVRELGAGAAAYLRKEADARAIVARVREAIRPKARVEARLRADGEIRGRLDGLTARSLLAMACELRRDARVSIRDASFHYEVEIRGGIPRRATRSAGDGSFLRGARVLSWMLGIGAGRFVVTPSTSYLPDELGGVPLADLLAMPIATARGAMLATTGTRALGIERIALDPEAVDDYLRATPEPTRSAVMRLAKGESPRALLLSASIEPGLLDDVLSDLAARGAICGVVGANQVDLLSPLVDGSLEAMNREPPGRAKTPSPVPPAQLIAEQLRASAQSSLADAVLREMDRSPRPASEVSRTPLRGAAERDTAERDLSIPISFEEDRSSTPVPLVTTRRKDEPKPKEGRWRLFGVAIACLVFAFGAVRVTSVPKPPPPAAAAGAHRPTEAPSGGDTTFAELPVGAQVKAGEGLLELTTSNDGPISVDGTERGRGPTLALPLAAGYHDVRVGSESQIVEVRAGSVTRAMLSPTP